jgi:hypothetical protein
VTLPAHGAAPLGHPGAVHPAQMIVDLTVWESTSVAFTFRHRFDPGDEVGNCGSDRDTCPA